MDRKVADFYADLMRISQQAFDQGCFDIAYDALCGATHAAERLTDRPRLRHISAIATSRVYMPTEPSLIRVVSFRSTRGHGGPHSYIGLIRSVEVTLERLRTRGSKRYEQTS